MDLGEVSVGRRIAVKDEYNIDLIYTLGQRDETVFESEPLEFFSPLTKFEDDHLVIINYEGEFVTFFDGFAKLYERIINDIVKRGYNKCSGFEQFELETAVYTGFDGDYEKTNRKKIHMGSDIFSCHDIPFELNVDMP